MCSLLALGEWVGPRRDSLIWITELQLLQTYSQSFHLFSLPFLQSLLLCLVECVCAYMVMSLKFSRVRFSLGERWRREGSGALFLQSSCPAQGAAQHCSSPAGEESNGEMYRQVQKNKPHFKYVELCSVCLLGL